MKLKIFPLSTHHILSFKIYQKIRIIFILLQKTSKRQYHLFLVKGKYFQFRQQVFFYFPKYNSGNSRCWQYQLETIVCVWNISVSSKKGPIQFEKYPFHLKTCVILYEKKSTFTDESLPNSKFIFQQIARGNLN